MLKIKFTLILLIGLALLNTSCTNDALDHEEEHAEPVGFFLLESGVTKVTYQNATVTGSFTIQSGEQTGLISVVFFDADNDEFTPEGDEYSLNLSTSNSEFSFIQHEEDGKWNFHLSGLAAGSGTFVLKVMHGEHSDFVSNPIPVTVVASSN